MSVLPSRILFRLSPVWMAVVVFVTICGAFATTLSYFYFQSRQQQERFLKAKVLGLSKTAASLVDVDLHERLDRPEQVSSEIYQRALKPLVSLHLQHPDIHYVYSMRVGDDGKESFVLDTANDPAVAKMMQGSGREVMPSQPGELYEVPDHQENRQAQEAMEMGRAYGYGGMLKDEFGTFISAQAPLFDGAGRYIGYAGVDYSPQALLVSLAQLRKTGAISMGIATLLSFALAFVAYGMRMEAVSRLAEAEHAERQARLEKERAEKAVGAKADLLAVAAHDLKNPLSAISGMAELTLEVLDVKKDPDLHMRLKLISDASGQMSNVIHDILTHEGLEHRGLQCHATPVDVGGLVERVVEFNQPSAKRKGITIETHIESGLCAELDKVRMHEAMDNLINNAVKYGPIGSRVEVTLRADMASGEMRFEVKDGGAGIRQEDMKKLFHKFSKLGSVPTGGELSTGLGLSIAKTIVEMHGGRIGCDSRVGEGTTFWVALPAVSCSLPQAV